MFDRSLLVFLFLGCSLLAAPGFAQDAAQFEELGFLSGKTETSRARAVSSNGQVVVGHSVGTDNVEEAFRWTEVGGMQGLGYLSGGSVISHAWDVSADGSVVVGWSDNGNGQIEAFRWTVADGMQGLGDLPGGSFGSGALAVSAEGDVIVGYATGPDGMEAFRWTSSGGMEGLGYLPGGSMSSQALDVSADGSVVVGRSQNAGGATEAFRWTEADGMVGLSELPGGEALSVARATSADGQVVVGWSGTADGMAAFRWTASEGMTELGDLPGGDVASAAFAVSDDGQVVAGSGTGPDGSAAVVWHGPDAGASAPSKRAAPVLSEWAMYRLETVLAFQGLPVEFIVMLELAALTYTPEGRLVLACIFQNTGRREEAGRVSMEHDALSDSNLADEQTTANHANDGESGDPISTFTGEFFSTAPADLNLGGPLPLVFRRYYASFLERDGKVQSSLGPNWSHTFDGRLLQPASGYAELIGSRGRVTSFTHHEGTWVQIDNLDLPYQLVDDADGFRVANPRTQRIHAFDADGRLVEISDGRGNALTLAYSGDQLTEVTDGLGRSLSFTYSGERLMQVSDGTRTVSFAYTDGLLTSATDPLGHATTYGYDAANERPGLLTVTTHPEGNARYTQVYDTDGRVTEQITALGNAYAISYGEGTTTVTDPLGHAMQHHYADIGRLTGYTDEAEQTVDLTYSAQGRRTGITDRLGAGTSFAFHEPSGLPASTTSANGAMTILTYTPRSADAFTFYDVTRIAFADGTSINLSYDANGNLTSVTDRAGGTYTYTYNSRGQVLTATNPQGGTTAFTYNDDGTYASVEDPEANTTTLTHDNLRRPTAITHPDGTTRTFAYDDGDRLVTLTTERDLTYTFAYADNDNLASVTDPNGRTTQYSYDAMDRIVEATDRLGNTLAFTYDGLGRLDGRTDRTGATTHFGYDSRGRLTSITDGAGQTWAMTYDDEGVITALVNPLGETTTITTNAMGWPTQITSPMGNSTRITYGAQGRVTGVQDPLNETTSLARDARGLLAEATLPGATSAMYDRDHLGLLTAMTDPNGEVWSAPRDAQGRITALTDPFGRTAANTFDARSRVVQVTQPSGLGTVSLTYDEANNLTSIAHDDGTALSYAYDDNGRLTFATGTTLVRDAEGRITASNGIAFSRDAEGRLASVTLPAGAVTFSYSARGLLTEVTDWQDGTTKLSYDGAARRTAIARPNGVTTRYDYDADGRLARIETQHSAGDTGEPEVYATATLERDARGQITAAIHDTPPTPALTREHRTYQHDAASQVDSWMHDALGRRTGDGIRTFTWDGLSRLASYTKNGETVSFTYDAFGNRLTREASEEVRSYLWNYALGLPSVAVEQKDGADAHYYVHTPAGELLYRVNAADGSREYYHYDEMGNTQFVTDDDGQVVASYVYSPYGELLAAEGEAADNTFIWQGRFGVMQEAEDLYYMRARYYDAPSGRFLSRDPVRLLHPAEIAPYQYARGNPMYFTDPTGLKADWSHFFDPILQDPADALILGQSKRQAVLKFRYLPNATGSPASINTDIEDPSDVAEECPVTNGGLSLGGQQTALTFTGWGTSLLFGSVETAAKAEVSRALGQGVRTGNFGPYQSASTGSKVIKGMSGGASFALGALGEGLQSAHEGQSAATTAVRSGWAGGVSVVTSFALGSAALPIAVADWATGGNVSNTLVQPARVGTAVFAHERECRATAQAIKSGEYGASLGGLYIMGEWIEEGTGLSDYLTWMF